MQIKSEDINNECLEENGPWESASQAKGLDLDRF